MSSYAFKAVDLAGAPVKGEIDAEDKQASAGDVLARFRRVKPDDLVVATRQLSTMVSSGMSLLRALYVIEEQTENDKLRDAWGEIRRDVEAGLALSDAMRRHPEIFNDLYVAMVAAGES